MFTKALAPLDGTEVSEGIIPFITQFARGLDMGVVLATAVEFGPLRSGALGRLEGGLIHPYPRTRSGTVHQSRTSCGSRAQRDVKSRLDDLADRIALEGISAETSVGCGPASETIIGMAQESNCDLIAMSTRGRGALGSVTYKIMHESPVPALAITPERAKLHWDTDYGVSRVIVPLDGSELAESALPYAAALSRRMDMSVTLVQVLPPDDFYTDGYTVIEVEPGAGDQMRADARRYLEGDCQSDAGRGSRGRRGNRPGKALFRDSRDGARNGPQHDSSRHPRAFRNEPAAAGQRRGGGGQGVGRSGACRSFVNDYNPSVGGRYRPVASVIDTAPSTRGLSALRGRRPR